MTSRKMFYREVRWECGCYQTVAIFPVYQKPGMRRSKCAPTSDVQKKLNDKHSREHLKRLIHLNFTEGDHVIGFDYAENCLPDDDAQAKRDIQNLLRRLKRLYSRHGAELMYVMVYERSEKGRPHFHVICNNAGIPEALIRDKWNFGRTDVDPLQFNENGVVQLSQYLSKSNLFSKRWCASKNLKQPRAKTRDFSLTKKLVEAIRIEDAAEIRKTYGENVNIINCDIINNEVNRADYIYLEMFDYALFCDSVGKKRYERKVKKSKFAARTDARKE